MAEVTRWWLVRHAPLVPAWRGAVVGRTDAEAETGFDPAPWQAILGQAGPWVVTPLRRTQQTARALGGHGWTVAPGFVEQDFGHWEGQRWEALMQGDPEAARFWAAYDRHRPPAGETLEELQQRCRATFLELSERFEGQTVVAVLHAGPIRALLASFLDMPLGSTLKLSVDPLSLSLVEGVGGDWQVRAINHAPAGRFA